MAKWKPGFKRAALLLGLTAALAPPTSANVRTPTPAADRARPGLLGFGYDYTLPRDSESQAGSMFVRVVLEGGPAGQAGLKVQDVIDAIDGRPLRFDDDLDLSRVDSSSRLARLGNQKCWSASTGA